jgi:hypothetical protein
VSFEVMSDSQASEQLKLFKTEWGDKPFTATDLVEWQKRQERFGLRLVEREEKVPSVVTVNEEGQAMMDARFWMWYASRANKMRNAIIHALEQIDAMEPAGSRVNAIEKVLREAVKP